MKAVAKKSPSQEAHIAKRFGNKNGVHSTSRSAFAFPNYQPIQRKPGCPCGGGCPRCKEELNLQTKLRIGEPGDKYEQEADRVAEQVMRMPELNVQRQVEREEKEEGELLQPQPLAGQITPVIQRQVEEEEEEEELLQAKSAPDQTPEVTPALANHINALPGGGQPLHPATRAFMEPRFGQDFSQVRVHTDSRAAETARTVNARAFTVGRDVVFGAGQYAPERSEGQRLLAHELTHMVQQRSLSESGYVRGGIISRAEDDDETISNDKLVGRFIEAFDKQNYKKALNLLGKIGVNAKDANGHTLLVHAILIHNISMISFLLENGADPNVKFPLSIAPVNFRDMNPLIVAVISNDHDLIELLLNSGADMYQIESIRVHNAPIYAVRGGKLEALRILMKHELDLNFRDPDGMTLLMHAASNCQFEIVRFLLDQGVQISEPRDNKQQHALDHGKLGSEAWGYELSRRSGQEVIWHGDEDLLEKYRAEMKELQRRLEDCNEIIEILEPYFTITVPQNGS